MGCNSLEAPKGQNTDHPPLSYLILIPGPSAGLCPGGWQGRGRPMGVTLWGSWGGAFAQPSQACGQLWSAVTPPPAPNSGPSQGKAPVREDKPPGAEVLVLIYAFYSSLRRCYRSLRTEIKACILQVQIYCTYSFTVSLQGGSINLVTVKFLRKLVSSSWVILNWSLGEE